ncbi:MAG: fasciclin domain-containing protein [Richelia sp. RM2_1_2]|nr:fasciclin domain-containing protein [Richelia sp. SM1_7_0]NJO61847.1 fasciclin domain-containing protein [Richelia sp. RM2_1_2]
MITEICISCIRLNVIRVGGNREWVIVNDASVTDANIAASNGVIHAVNRVLLPQQLRQAIASRLAMQ